MIDRIYGTWVRGGAPYFKLLDDIHCHLAPRTYVEVGVAAGRSMMLSLPGARNIGIDPAPNISWPIDAHDTTIFELKSNDFFDTYDLIAELGGKPVDLAFIDGLHTLPAAMRDFLHLEAYGTPDTTVLFHDVLPLNEASTSEGYAGPDGPCVWAGNVWRCILALIAWRPDLNVTVVDAAPTGVAIVRGLDPNSSVLRQHFDEIVEEFRAVSYDDLERRGKFEALHVIPNDWSRGTGSLAG